MAVQDSAFLRQTQWGESRWWSWFSTVWFAMIIWIVISTLITAPMPYILENTTDPDAFDQYRNVAQAFQSTIDQNYLDKLTQILTLSTLVGGLAWLILRVTSGIVARISACMALIGMLMSTVAFILIYPLGTDPEVMATYMPLIGQSVYAYALMLLSYPAMLVGLYLCQRYIHNRTLVSLHTVAARIRWGRIIFAIGVTWAVLAIVAVGLHVTGISPVTLNFNPTLFLSFAIATLIFIPLQSGTEEIVFRGYLNQAFGHFISNKWIVFAITSFLFACVHLSNPEAQEGAEGGNIMHLLVMSQYFIFGFILSAIVYFDNGIEAAIGVHAANNMFAAIFVNYEGSALPTPSLFMSKTNANIDAPILVMTLVAIAFILYKTRKTAVPAARPLAIP